MKSYQQLHQEIIEKLQADLRPLVKLEAEELTHLKEEWQKCLQSGDFIKLHKILCILDNTQTYSPLFDSLFYESLKKIQDPETLIALLAAAQKQVISRMSREGNPIPGEFVESMRRLIAFDHPELLEWTLRIVEQLGRQSLTLREDILKRKPGIMAIFNKHKVASRQIIELLERRWKPFVR